MKKRLLVLIIVFMGVFWHQTSFGLSSLAKNDPYPLFSTSYPYEYLLDRTKNYLKGIECDYCPSHFGLAFSGFYQKANCGRNYDREKVPLGDLEGRWNMLGMLYGGTPAGAKPATLAGTRLAEAKQALFFPPPQPNPFDPNAIVPFNSILTDSSQMVGFFSVPSKYRKHGVRFEVYFQPFEDVGLFIQGGYADIKNTATSLINLTPSFADAQQIAPQFSEMQIDLINDLLMSSSSANRIFKEQGIEKNSNTQNRCDFRESSFEDLRFSLWGRHIFCLNEFSCDWPPFLFIPFFHLEGSVAPGKRINRMRALALPFGNDGHASIGFTAGFHIDFIETVEIGFHGGVTHFFSRDVDCYRLPSHPTQSGVFPFATAVKLQPGNNHHFAALFHAYRFIGKLSAHVEFVVVNHDEDHITLKPPAQDAALCGINQPAFCVQQQECQTKFMSQFLTTAGNYEISPNLTLGFAVQWPIQQRNAFRSTTVIGTIRGVF